MRIWDIHPGYLNRQSLLGEHRELHGIVSVITRHKKAFSRHPETLRWVKHGWALKMRHQQLSCEMALRGYHDRSPVRMRSGRGEWPETYIDEPAKQFELIAEKYKNKDPGRIHIPRNTQQLWAQHEYSVLARHPILYKTIGNDVANNEQSFDELALLLSEILRAPPEKGGLYNALQYMWGHVSDKAEADNHEVDKWSHRKLLNEIQKRARQQKKSYLLASTALSDLMVWV